MNPSPHMSCDEVETLLPLVADGALDATSEPALFSHVASCQCCQDSLALHDLVGISLSQPTAKPTPRVIRPTWQRYAPAAAAALVLIGVGAIGWQGHGAASGGHGDAKAIASKQPVHAEATPGANAPAAKSAPIPTPPVQVARNEPIDIEVIAVPGSTSSHLHYLVRKGEQVLFIDPAAQERSAQAPSDIQAASYRRY